LNSFAFPDIIKPIISPNKPIIDPKISTTSTLTNKDASAASAKAALEPEIPTQIPQARSEKPTHKPAQNNEKAV